MNSQPLVSVVIPTYNRGHLIKDSIESVFNQTYKNIELIIVDDASTDNTKEIVTSIKNDRLVYIRMEDNRGPSAARNKGIKTAKGEIVAFLDSDDRWYPEKTEEQVKLLINSGKPVGAVFCGMEFYDYKTKEKTGEHIITVDIKKNFLKGKHFLTPPMVTVLAYKKVLEEVGGLDETLKANEDTELAIKICKNYEFALLNKVLVKVTRNHEQLMANDKNYIKAREIIFYKHYDFLSKDILFGLAKQIANYSILHSDISKAKKFTIEALKLRPLNIKTIGQLALLAISPGLTKKIFSEKHSGTVKLSGLKT